MNKYYVSDNDNYCEAKSSQQKREEEGTRGCIARKNLSEDITFELGPE